MGLCSMPYEDLRHFIRDLEEYNLFRWVDAEVDKDWEISAVTRTYFRRVPKETRGALGFRNIKGWPGHRLVVGTVGGGVEVYHRALGIERGGFDAVNRKWREALTRPIPAVLTDGDAPCQEVVRMGEEADLHRFPHSHLDPGEGPRPFPDLALPGDEGPGDGGGERGRLPVGGQGTSKDRGLVGPSEPARSGPFRRV